MNSTYGGSQMSGEIYSPGTNADDSVLFPDTHYKSRGRTPPSQRDRQARLKSPNPGQHGPRCICEMCSCGKHACPAHGRKKTPFDTGGSSYGQAYRPYSPSEYPEPPKLIEKKERPQSKFLGETSYQHGYSRPPGDAYNAAFNQASLPEERFSSRRKTPPRTNKNGRAQFEGVSAYQRDYNPPPKDAFQQIKDEDAMAMSKLQQPVKKDGRAMFEGMSSNHRDFRAPPPEALRQNENPPAEISDRKLITRDKVRQGPQFEGSSQMRRDFTPPPKDAYGRKEKPSDLIPDGALVKTHNPSGTRRFEGESQTRRDYLPPPRDAYDGSNQQPPESLLADRQLVPRRPNAKFDGASTSQRNFAPPPRDAYRAGSDAGRSKTPNKQPRPNTRFEGQTTSGSQYTKPPRDAYTLATASVVEQPKKSNKIPDSRNFQSTSAMNYQAPPAPPPRCRASLLLAEGPPTPGSGRHHVYYDQNNKSWY